MVVHQDVSEVVSHGLRDVLPVRRVVRDGPRKPLKGFIRLVRPLQGLECTDAFFACVTEYSNAHKMHPDARTTH